MFKRHTQIIFSIEVTQARNRQNAVDLKILHLWMKTKLPKRYLLNMAGITYLIKQGDDDPPNSETCFSIRELVPLLACTVTGNDWQQYVIAAKSDKRRLFRQLD